MSTYTSTSTYTVADVEKVMRSVKADLIMIASSTKAMTENNAAEYAHDIEALAKKNYLKFADVTLMDGFSEVRAIKYEFQTEGATGTARPGGVLWPLTGARKYHDLRHVAEHSHSPDRSAECPRSPR